MILLFNKIPVKLNKKIELMISKVKSILGSEFFNVQGSRWFGDKLTTNSLFPKWIIKKSNDDPNSVLIVQIIKSYQRWLFDVERGYGAAVPWETIHVPHKLSDKMLLGLADLYFPEQDFSSDNLKPLLPNLKVFSLKVEENYFRKKGTPDAIQYLLITLLGLPYDLCEVVTGSPGFIIVRANVPDQYKDFLNKSVYPAGMKIIYESV
jgi:hypothetical protein